MVRCSSSFDNIYLRSNQSQIVPLYVAVITPYIAFESLEIAPVRLAIPDVGIYERDQPGVLNTAVALAPAPLVVKAEMDVPTRYARIELRTVGDETLNTVIAAASFTRFNLTNRAY